MWHQLSSIAGAARITSSQSCAIGPSAFPVTTHFGPGHACAASSVSGVSASCETNTTRSASRSGRSTSSSACTASPPVCAAWNDVPQPQKSSRAPSGNRLSVGTFASHSG